MFVFVKFGNERVLRQDQIELGRKIEQHDAYVLYNDRMDSLLWHGRVNLNEYLTLSNIYIKSAADDFAKLYAKMLTNSFTEN